MPQIDLPSVFYDDVKDHLSKEGYSPSYGARPLRRVLQRQIEDELSEEFLMGKFKEGDTVIAKLDGNKIVFEKTDEKPPKSDKGEKSDKTGKSKSSSSGPSSASSSSSEITA